MKRGYKKKLQTGESRHNGVALPDERIYHVNGIFLKTKPSRPRMPFVSRQFKKPKLNVSITTKMEA